MKPNSPSHNERTFALIDIENLTGTPLPSENECSRVRSIVENHIDASHTPVVAACSHLAARTAPFAWPTARWKWKSGLNGADEALLEELDVDHIASRFTKVLIGSGDGIFADIAARLASRGVHVEVISRTCSLSRRLQLAAKTVVVFDEFTATAQPSLAFQGADVA